METRPDDVLPKPCSIQVMSLTLDDWSREEYELMIKSGGNQAVNLALNPGNEPCPDNTDLGRLETFVLNKYVTHRLRRQYLKMHQKRVRGSNSSRTDAQSPGSSSNINNSTANAANQARHASPRAEDSASVGLQPTWKATLQPGSTQQQQKNEPFFTLDSEQAGHNQMMAANAQGPAPQMISAASAQAQPQSQQLEQQQQQQPQYQMMSSFSQPMMSMPAYPQQQPMFQQPQMMLPQQVAFTSLPGMPMQQQLQPMMYATQPQWTTASANMQPQQPQYFTQQQQQQQPQMMTSFPAFQQPQQQQYFVYQ